MTGVQKSTISWRCKKGIIAYEKIGRQYYLTKDTIDDIIKTESISISRRIGRKMKAEKNYGLHNTPTPVMMFDQLIKSQIKN